ncbi:hypothetical protein KY342_03055, partial [Candidatus Woesearchaeota archaeon]|nr:hypothetical protein [Candidatus Woesearchaeota archaeon]
KNHPQLDRFKKVPIKYINTYLYFLYKESCDRGYCFDKRNVVKPFTKKKLAVTDKQLKYELQHLKKKLKIRNKEKYKEILKIKNPKPNPLFKVKKGPIEKWEKV